MIRKATVLLASLALSLSACDGGGEPSTTLGVSWSFSSGSCESLALETVRITWGPQGGSSESVDLPCTDGGATLGVAEPGKTWVIGAAGFDAGGVQRAESYGTWVTLGGSVPPEVVAEVTLSPKRANVVVTWSMSGGGCPWGTIIPYVVSLYPPPAVPGGALTQRVAYTQVSCTAQEATLERIAPGDYVVEVNSVTTSPKVYGKTDVTVVPGEDASAHFSF